MSGGQEQWTAAQYQERMGRLKMSQKHAGRYKAGSANELTKSIIQWMNWNGFVVWRNNTMGVFDGMATAKKLLGLIKHCVSTRRIPTIAEIKRLFVYRKSHERKGVSDIIGFEKKTGRFVAVEVKFGNDTIGEHQQQFLDQVRKNGGIAIVARGMENFLQDVEQFMAS